MCLSERSERHERIAGGWLPVSAFAERALTVIAPGPPITGDALQENLHAFPAGKDMIAGSSCLGALAPTRFEI